MITLNLKWFVGLSVAAHAAVLVGWQAPLITPGNSGHVMQLSVVQQTGSRPQQAAALATSDQSRRMPETAATATAANNPATDSTARRKASVRPAPPLFQTVPAPVQRVATEPVTASTTALKPASSLLAQQHVTDRHLRDSIMKLITRELTYPAIARRKGWQGVVKLELHIEADGSITGLQLDETSGYAVLDRAALQCLQTAHIPDASQWLRGKPADIIVPVEYRLVDG